MNIRIISIFFSLSLLLAACTDTAPVPEQLTLAQSTPDTPSIVQTVSASSSSSSEANPALSISCGESVVSLTAGEAAKQVQVRSLDALPATEDGALSVEIIKNGETLFQDYASQLETFLPQQNGIYLYKLSDSAGFEYLLEANVQLPVEISFSDTAITLGETLVL